MPDVFLPELISEVVSYLDPANIQDLHALTACNLVSLAFSSASRPVLFRTICLSPDLTVHGFYERELVTMLPSAISNPSSPNPQIFLSMFGLSILTISTVMPGTRGR